MYPDVPQNQPTGATNLPPVAPQPQPGPVAQSPGPASAVPIAGQVPVSQDIVQAKQLVAQYAQNPFQLSQALNQLKARHLAEQYQINPNAVEN